MTNFHDNPFETDGSMHNIRVMRNMMINSASHAFCNQPSLGGPVYWIRNIAYHLPGGSTRLTSGSAGVLFYNNTILSETAAAGASNVHWRNNLLLGENSAPAIFSVNTYTNYTSSDYNGFRPNPARESSFQWNVAAGRRARPTSPAPAQRGRSSRRGSSRRSPNTAQATGQDQHSVLVDYDVFVNVPRLDAQDRSTVQKVYKAEDFDFRLRAGRRRRSRHRAAERHRRLHRPRAGPRRARSRSAGAALRTAEAVGPGGNDEALAFGERSATPDSTASRRTGGVANADASRPAALGDAVA